MADGRLSPLTAGITYQVELYDMDADRTELHDLASQHPEKLEEMVRQWQSWAERVGVQPWPFENKK